MNNWTFNSYSHSAFRTSFAKSFACTLAKLTAKEGVVEWDREQHGFHSTPSIASIRKYCKGNSSERSCPDTSSCPFQKFISKWLRTSQNLQLNSGASWDLKKCFHSNWDCNLCSCINCHRSKYYRSFVKTKHLSLYFCKSACPVYDLLTAASDMHCHAAACKRLKLKTQLLDVVEL